MFKTFYLTAKLQKIHNVMLVELDLLRRHVVFLIISIYKKKNIFFRYLFDYVEWIIGPTTQSLIFHIEKFTTTSSQRERSKRFV